MSGLVGVGEQRHTVEAAVSTHRVTDVPIPRRRPAREGRNARSGDARGGDEEGDRTISQWASLPRLCLLGPLDLRMITRGIAKGGGWITWSAALTSARAGVPGR
jgi:hypothetical protein